MGFLKDLLKDIIIAVAIVLLITVCIKPTIVSGNSMNDTLQHKNYLIVNKLAYKFGEPEYGDIIVFDSDFNGGELLVKRVIGLPGDVVETDGKTTYINGAKASEPYIKSGTEGEPAMQTWTVPEGCLFVMGDNRDRSADSRNPDVGYVEESTILGKVAIRLRPISDFGTVQ